MNKNVSKIPNVQIKRSNYYGINENCGKFNQLKSQADMVVLLNKVE